MLRRYAATSGLLYMMAFFSAVPSLHARECASASPARAAGSIASHPSLAATFAFRETNSLQISKRPLRAAYINEVEPLQGEKKKEI